ncbi:uncharacterized protein LOC118430004 isoform X2 [Branchiostoma floridae]|uniref:Uncharacterized protein LOC118430004 isoform X2 n=1 Tax=Branchiostoma floridae TaxID=7739 RepID=A0A9J7M9N0_BRAFL|nr:uncharacterized protein LOC118430004 isoform X2 [Branchiostoma floridae]
MKVSRVLWRIAQARGIFVLVGFAVGIFSSSLLKAPTIQQVAMTPRRTASSWQPRQTRHDGLRDKVIAESNRFAQTNGKRKILLDCGGNVASTVQLFRETYPDGKDYVIHSFELDDRLAPYFAPYSNHVLHCPTAVSNKDGNMTAYAESAWSPGKGKTSGRDMQWGGGTLFAHKKEIQDNITGGSRRLTYRRTVPTVDLSRWIKENTNVDDYVIFKLDVEGAEYDILTKMLKEDTFRWIDKYYGEYHGWQSVAGWNKADKAQLIEEVETKGKPLLRWTGEKRTYEDFDVLHPKLVGSVGKPGVVYSNCIGSAQKRPKLALVVQVGMNAKSARKLVTTLAAHTSNIPLALFVYGDFVELFPQQVEDWAERFTIGMREGQPFPPGHFALQAPGWIRFSLVSAIERHRDIGLQSTLYLAENVTKSVITVAKDRGLSLIQPTARFPPTKEKSYYHYRDVERVPKALRVIADGLGNTGGILSLDSDHPDSYMISAFLLDYLVENSGFELVSIEECLTE